MNEFAGRTRGAVHAAVGHDSAVAHVTGAARYLDDVPVVPGTLEAALVLSPHAHARIRRVDLSAARAAPGVVAAITAADIPGKNDIAPIRSDEPALAADVVEYDGQPVAAIAATTLDQARAAAKLAAIDYEPLAPVLTIEEAIARESYVSPPQIMVRGEVEEALGRAPHRLAGELRCGGQDHFYLEGQIALATPGEASDMHVWSSTQHPTEVQRGVAHLLGLPFNAVTVEVRRMGGAFGGKESQATIIAGKAVRRARERFFDLPAYHDLWRRNVTLARHRFFDRQHRGERLVIDRNELCRRACPIERRRRDRRYRLPVVFDHVRGQCRLIAAHRCDVVLAGNIGGGDRGEHARGGESGGKIDAADTGMRMWAQHQGRFQCS